jgi:amino acid transporter
MATTPTAAGGLAPAAPRRQLTLLDSTSIIVGIIIGSSLYESTPLIANMVPSSGWLEWTLTWLPGSPTLSVPGTAWLVGFWVLGGLLSLVGALVYAELATAYPESGGDYVYLTRAFGRRLGFLFGWAQLWVVRPGSIGAMAFVFARYANELLVFFLARLAPDLAPLVSGRAALAAWAVAAIVVLSLVNMLGVQQGKWTQNVLTLAKVLGVVAIVAAGFFWATPPQAAAPAGPPSSGDFRLALILILYAYGGWNEMAYVGAEVRNPEKNIVRALVLGTVAVTVIYLLINLAFVRALGFEGLRNVLPEGKAVASEVLQRTRIGAVGSPLVSLLICITALGAINGLIFTGSRIYYAMGNDHRFFAWLGRWSPRWGTPVRSLAIQAAVTLALVVGFRLMHGPADQPAPGPQPAATAVAALQPAAPKPPPPTDFEGMVQFTTPVFWFFFLLIGETLFILRDREPGVRRPFRVPWFPRLAIWFYLSSLFMLYSSISYAIEKQAYEALWAVGVVLLGLAVSYFDPRMKAAVG